MGGNNIIKKGLVVAVILLFVSVSVIPSTGTTDVKQITLPTTSGDTLYVGGNGTGNYTRIRDAIRDAGHGDTVFVYDDSSPYYEYHLCIVRNINLIGENKHTTVIDGQKKGFILEVSASRCNITGFTLRKCEQSYSTRKSWIIRILSDYNTVEDNILSIGYDSHCIMSCIFIAGSHNKIRNNTLYETEESNIWSGIRLCGGASYNNISRNDISWYTNGVLVDSSAGCYNNIMNNKIHHNHNAIYIRANSTNISHNNITENGDGIDIIFARNTVIQYNIIKQNGGGLSCEFSYGTTIIGNVISSNGDWLDNGLWFVDSDFMYVADNIISKNGDIGIILTTSTYCVFLRNNIIDNKVRNLEFLYKVGINFNIWHRNYWSDYKGFGVKFIFGFKSFRPWFIIDFSPAKEPYDIPIPEV